MKSGNIREAGCFVNFLLLVILILIFAVPCRKDQEQEQEQEQEGGRRNIVCA